MHRIRRDICISLKKAGAAETNELITAATSVDASYYGLWIQSGAIVVSAVGVVLTILWSKIVAGRRATLDIVLSEQTDPEHVKQRTHFVTLRDAGNLSKFAEAGETHGEDAATVRAVLNRYELVAIGISSGTLDSKSYKKWCRTTLVKDWTCMKPLVMQLRHNASTPTYYCEFEELAKAWANREERKHI